jgi:hypothetical protein
MGDIAGSAGAAVDEVGRLAHDAAPGAAEDPQRNGGPVHDGSGA